MSETAEQKQDPLNTPEINKASREFSMLIPKVKSQSRNLKARAVARVLSAVVEFPLTPEYPKFQSKDEQDLFMMCLHALSCKDTMIESFVKNRDEMEKIKEEVTDKVVQEIMEKESK